MVRAALARSVGQDLPAEAVYQFLGQDRAKPNDEIPGDAVVTIEAEWRILVGIIFAAKKKSGLNRAGSENTAGLRCPSQRPSLRARRSHGDRSMSYHASRVAGSIVLSVHVILISWDNRRTVF